MTEQPSMSQPSMSQPSMSQPSLARRLGTFDAVVIGLGSMIGAGVFAVFGPAARAAGWGLLAGLVLAAGVAWCNAMASAQLAAAYPLSGGTYVYGRERLGPWWGFVAGWGFVVGKTASCAAMALTFAAYAVPGPTWARRGGAIAAVLAVTALNYRGVTRTAFLTRVLVTCSLTALTVTVAGIGIGLSSHDTARTSIELGLGSNGVLGVLQAAGLLFFAFAGYARIVTMGEEVRDPARTIPRAVAMALTGAVTVYVIVGVAALVAAGPDRLAASSAPLTDAVRAAGVGGLAPVVRIGAALAGLGALLALVAGIGRTGLAMARERDLPSWLAAVHPRFRVPHHAEVTLAVVVCLLVATVDLRGAIGFSSFGVLLYYAIANAAAFTQPVEQRRMSRTFNVIGAAACLLLVATLPIGSVVSGLLVFAVGLGGRAVVLSLRRWRTTRRRLAP